MSTQYRLLELADPSQRRPMLLRIGDPPVAPVPPQLVAEVLHTVGLCLRTDFTLREEQRSKCLDEDEPYFRNKQIKARMG